MRTALIALAVLPLLSLPRVPSAQAQTPSRQCLHDQLETQANRTRRDKAIELAAEINRAQGFARRFGPRPGQGAYKRLDELSALPDTPEGFRLQFHTDGTTYSFSLKDTRDPCGYAVFSDQSTDIYEAVPTPLKAVPRLLTQK